MEDILSTLRQNVDEDEREHREFIMKELGKYHIVWHTGKYDMINYGKNSKRTLHELEILREFLITISEQFPEYFHDFIFNVTCENCYCVLTDTGLPSSVRDRRYTAKIPMWMVSISIAYNSSLYNEVYVYALDNLNGVPIHQSEDLYFLEPMVCFRRTDIRPEEFKLLYQYGLGFTNNPRFYCSSKFSVLDMSSNQRFPVNDQYIQIWKRDNPLAHTLDLT